MEKYIDIFINGYKSYASYLWGEVSNPSWHNYFYWLIGGSLLFFALELARPWRKEQPKFRKDFWLDTFYMFFNFFLFSLIVFNAASDVFVNLLNDGIKAISGGFDLQASNPMRNFPYWAVLLIGMVARDFIQWWIHRLLHKFDWLWNFHKVHHSVEEMGFAAQLRYHWMENIVYRSLEYIPLALMGIGLYDFFIIHIFAFTWGHYNHANFSVSKYIVAGVVGGLVGIVIANSLLDVHLFTDLSSLAKFGVVLASTGAGAVILGPFMKIIFNSPEMHIWHHSYELPEERRFGVNFGLTLGLWDYIFGTNYIPHDGRDIRLGFSKIEQFPSSFVGQQVYGLGKKED